MYQLTQATQKLQQLSKRIRGVSGGTSASKTVSILLILITYAQKNDNKVISIVSESMPHLRKGAMRDFLNIMKEHNYFQDNRWEKTNSIYTFETGSIIEFFGVESWEKVKGARRDILFINEANHLTYETYTQLEVRTKEIIWLDWNPEAEFWFYTDVMNLDNVDFLTLTYKDNEALDINIVKAIEARKGNVAWWQVYGLGQLGVVEARIYQGWQILENIPHEAQLRRYGLDFGYTNDPTAIIAIYYYNGGYILDEIAYQYGMTNRDIFDVLINQPHALVIADSAEPKSIDEIKLFRLEGKGINVMPSVKGPDSVKQGIQYVQQQRISVTSRSVSLIKEYRNYLWITDKEGKTINEPQEFMNHCVDGNTLVDTTKGQIKIKNLVGKKGYLYSENGKIRKFYDVRQIGIEQIYEVEFIDGRKIFCSGEHPFKLKSGDWCPASLLYPMDMIQSVTYGNTDIQWKGIQTLSWRKILQSWEETLTSSCLGILQWVNSNRFPNSPQRRESTQQFNRESGIGAKTFSSKQSYDTPKEAETKKMGKQNQSAGFKMAWFGRRINLSFRTWQNLMAKEKEDKKKLLTMWQRIQYLYWDTFKVLPPELQNESQTTQIKRITRKSYKRAVYNLEVEDTCCYSINGGILVSNCMDSVRYAINSFKPIGPIKKMPGVGGIKPFFTGLPG